MRLEVRGAFSVDHLSAVIGIPDFVVKVLLRLEFQELDQLSSVR